MKAGNIRTGARLRVVLDRDVAIGPGKADLLEAIAETGSIAAAGRRMGMSYKRAWLHIEALNGAFREPLVNATRGGRAQGGAALTGAGEEVLTRYRAMEAAATRAVDDNIAALKALLRPRDA